MSKATQPATEAADKALPEDRDWDVFVSAHLERAKDAPMSARWDQPCPYDGPAHDFTPLRDGHERFIHNDLIRAICRKCGAYR